jgi:hypothetical protein
MAREHRSRVENKKTGPDSFSGYLNHALAEMKEKEAVCRLPTRPHALP